MVKRGTLFLFHHQTIQSITHPVYDLHIMSTQPSNKSSRTAHAALKVTCLLAAITATISLASCQKTLLHKDDARSPFDRYNQTRAQHAPPYLEDEYGRRTPNLRDRLVKSEE